VFFFFALFAGVTNVVCSIIKRNEKDHRTTIAVSRYLLLLVSLSQLLFPISMYSQFSILYVLDGVLQGGIEAVQDIIRLWPKQRTKIIAVTADAFEDTRDTCVANGFTGWLAKPFRVEEFARIMGQAT